MTFIPNKYRVQRSKWEGKKLTTNINLSNTHRSQKCHHHNSTAHFYRRICSSSSQSSTLLHHFHNRMWSLCRHITGLSLFDSGHFIYCLMKAVPHTWLFFFQWSRATHGLLLASFMNIWTLVFQCWKYRLELAHLMQPLSPGTFCTKAISHCTQLFNNTKAHKIFTCWFM